MYHSERRQTAGLHRCEAKRQILSGWRKDPSLRSGCGDDGSNLGSAMVLLGVKKGARGDEEVGNLSANVP